MGRATLGGSDDLAPALILLERTACSVLTVGSAGAGAGSFIKVLGYGKTPGSIHVDSAATGSDCGSGSNKQAFQGKQADGIIAYGSATPVGTTGIISSVATNNGKSANIVSDSLPNVYGTTAVSGTGTTKTAVVGRRSRSAEGRSMCATASASRTRSATARPPCLVDEPPRPRWPPPGRSPTAPRPARS